MKPIFTTLIIVLLINVTLPAQEVSLENLNPFEHIELINAEKIVVKNHDAENPYVLIKGLKAEDISYTLSAGTLVLKLNKEASEVIVGNNRLKRVKGPEGLVVEGAEYIGGEGNFLITDIKSHSFRGISIVNVDPDIDFDFDFDDQNFDVKVDVDHDWQSDFEWNWEWEWNWDDHRDEFRDTKHELKRELKNLKKEIKSHIHIDND